MKLLDKISRLFHAKDHRNEKFKVKVPNGWGRQNYNGVAKKAVFREPIDLNNIKAKRGWIRAFMVNKIEGFKTKKKWFNPYYSLKYKSFE